MNSEMTDKLSKTKRYFFDKETTLKFIDFLKNKSALYAPHKKGESSFAYEKVDDASQVVLDYPRTIQPLKKFFLPPMETLLSFNLSDNDFTEVQQETEDRIFFAVHSYEMQGVKRLDYSFEKGHPESNYLTRRDNAKFIGISYTPDKYHFSKSVGIEIEDTDGFCLYLEPVENGHIVFVIDEDGQKMINEFGGGQAVDTDVKIADKPFQTKIKYHYNRLPQVFEHVYNSKVWEEVAERCVGCGTCNLLCSTCYCFDVRDEIEINAADGKRERFWDGCMLNAFAEVAGGENFREDLASRTRHRLHRKFKYITEQSGELHCVGCGRCSKYCPAEINIITIINDLIDDFAEQQKKQVI